LSRGWEIFLRHEFLDCHAASGPIVTAASNHAVFDRVFTAPRSRHNTIEIDIFRAWTQTAILPEALAAFMYQRDLAEYFSFVLGCLSQINPAITDFVYGRKCISRFTAIIIFEDLINN
jgi:hypothetical protein